MNISKAYLITLLKRILLTAAFLYLLWPILEIFIPLNQLEQADSVKLFLFATALAVLFLSRWYFWLPVQLLLTAWTYRHYFPSTETGWAWLSGLGSEISQSLLQFWDGQLLVFPAHVALLLVLFLIGISAYLLINHMQPTTGILFCLGYLMILHVFTAYDFFAYIVRILGVGILILGLVQVPVEKGWRRALLSLLAVGVGSFVFVRLALWGTDNLVPQQQWVESRARGFQRTLQRNGFFEWVDSYNAGGGLRQLGYDEDDSELGGPVQQNFDHVLTSYDSEPHYWRISTKGLYTGRGWEDQIPKEEHLSLPLEEVFAPLLTQEQELRTVAVDVADNFGYFPYTYQTVNLTYGEEEVRSLEDFSLLIPSSEWVWEGEGWGPSEYQLTLVADELDFSLLQEAAYTEEELARMIPYLQLPDELPQRVIELARTITAGEETMYGKIRAIESYLRNKSGLRYSLREASVLPDGRDYVDFFLFDSQVGYCDNFSTAMVIMSRAIGIPSRWAKGFNMGTQQFDASQNAYYQVTNANAHSWPEVFFPGYGWLPFEPTPAFSQPLTNTLLSGPASDVFVFEEEINDVLEAEEAAENEEEVEPVAPETAEETEPEEGQERDAQPALRWELWVFPSLAVILIGFLFRRPLLRRMMQQILKSELLSPRKKASLVIALFQIGRPKQPSQTLRQYFSEIIQVVPMHKASLSAFVELQETLLYGSDPSILPKDEMTPIFLNVLPAFEDMQLKKQKSSF